MGIAMEKAGDASREGDTRRDQSDGLAAEMFRARLYKPTQGRITRQATAGAIWLAVALGAWRWFEAATGIAWLAENGYITFEVGHALRYILPSLFLLAGLWFGYRLVNYPKFADFLVAVEAEMNKVTWPSQDELVRSSVVVIFLLAAFTFVLFVFDVFWFWFFTLIGVR